MTSLISDDALSPEDIFELSENDFMFVFTLQDGVSKKVKMYERYIKWQVVFYSFDDAKLD